MSERPSTSPTTRATEDATDDRGNEAMALRGEATASERSEGRATAMAEAAGAKAEAAAAAEAAAEAKAAGAAEEAEERRPGAKALAGAGLAAAASSATACGRRREGISESRAASKGLTVTSGKPPSERHHASAMQHASAARPEEGSTIPMPAEASLHRTPAASVAMPPPDHAPHCTLTRGRPLAWADAHRASSKALKAP